MSTDFEVESNIAVGLERSTSLGLERKIQSPYELFRDLKGIRKTLKNDSTGAVSDSELFKLVDVVDRAGSVLADSEDRPNWKLELRFHDTLLHCLWDAVNLNSKPTDETLLKVRDYASRVADVAEQQYETDESDINNLRLARFYRKIARSMAGKIYRSKKGLNGDDTEVLKDLLEYRLRHTKIVSRVAHILNDSDDFRKIMRSSLDNARLAEELGLLAANDEERIRYGTIHYTMNTLCAVAAMKLFQNGDNECMRIVVTSYGCAANSLSRILPYFTNVDERKRFLDLAIEASRKSFWSRDGSQDFVDVGFQAKQGSNLLKFYAERAFHNGGDLSNYFAVVDELDAVDSLIPEDAKEFVEYRRVVTAPIVAFFNGDLSVVPVLVNDVRERFGKEPKFFTYLSTINQSFAEALKRK